jgi:2OG-Fe(II) oxygenase superfamily
MDSNALSYLIQDQHLRPEAVDALRSQFLSTAGRFHVIEDCLVPELAERLSQFLREQARFETEYGLYSADEHKVEEAEWMSAPVEDRFFRYGRLVGAGPQFQFSEQSVAYLRFRTAFQQDANLREFFEAVSGLELAQSDDFGSHSMGAGDFLKEHDDNNRNRRLALVLYLSPGWRREYGGALHIVDEAGREAVVEPIYNSLVAFDTLAGTTHYVVPIERAAGQERRVTIGGWYHQPV